MRLVASNPSLSAGNSLETPAKAGVSSSPSDSPHETLAGALKNAKQGSIGWYEVGCHPRKFCLCTSVHGAILARLTQVRAMGIRGGAVSHISLISAGVRPNAAFTTSETCRSSCSASRASLCSGRTEFVCSSFSRFRSATPSLNESRQFSFFLVVELFGTELLRPLLHLRACCIRCGRKREPFERGTDRGGPTRAGAMNRRR